MVLWILLCCLSVVWSGPIAQQQQKIDTFTIAVGNATIVQNATEVVGSNATAPVSPLVANDTALLSPPPPPPVANATVDQPPPTGGSFPTNDTTFHWNGADIGSAGAKTKCELERDNKMGIVTNQKNTIFYSPECESDGSYKRIQQHSELGVKWCVDRQTGQVVNGTVKNTSEPDPKCPGENGTAHFGLCQRVRQETVASTKGKAGAYVPQCSADGSFKSIQSKGSTGYKWCVNILTGEEVQGTEKAPWEGEPKCPPKATFDDTLNRNITAPLVDPLIGGSSNASETTVPAPSVGSDSNSLPPWLQKPMPAEKSEESNSTTLVANMTLQYPVNQKSLTPTNNSLIINSSLDTASPSNSSLDTASPSLLNITALPSLLNETTLQGGANESMSSPTVGGNGTAYPVALLATLNQTVLMSNGTIIQNETGLLMLNQTFFNETLNPMLDGLNATNATTGIVELSSNSQTELNGTSGTFGNFTGNSTNGTAGKSKCQNERLGTTLNSMMMGMFIPECEADGTYKQVQTHGSTGRKWCVDIDTGETINGTEKAASEGEPICPPLRKKDSAAVNLANATTPTASITEDKTLCQKERLSTTLNNMLMGMYVPECEADGSYKQIQTHGSTGRKWCVDVQTGEKINGTEKAAGEGDPDCPLTRDVFVYGDGAYYIKVTFDNQFDKDINVSLHGPYGQNFAMEKGGDKVMEIRSASAKPMVVSADDGAGEMVTVNGRTAYELVPVPESVNMNVYVVFGLPSAKTKTADLAPHYKNKTAMISNITSIANSSLSANTSAPANHEAKNSTILTNADEANELIAMSHKCNYTLKTKGCWNDRQIIPRPFPVLVIKDESVDVTQLIDKEAYSKFLPAFVCKCAEEVRKRKWWSFGIQNYVECHSGPDEGRFDEDGEATGAMCLNNNLESCAKDDTHCAGKDRANFVYTIVTDSHQDIKKIIYDKKKKRSAKTLRHMQKFKGILR